MATDGGVDELTGSVPTVYEVSSVTREGKDAIGCNRLKGVKKPIVCVLLVERAENIVKCLDEPLGA